MKRIETLADLRSDIQKGIGELDAGLGRELNVDAVITQLALDVETRAAVRDGMAQARRGEFVSNDDMADFFKQHGI